MIRKDVPRRDQLSALVTYLVGGIRWWVRSLSGNLLSTGVGGPCCRRPGGRRSEGFGGRTMHSFCRLFCAAMALLGGFILALGAGGFVSRGTPASAADAIPCVSNTQPPFPEAGFCADYN